MMLTWLPAVLLLVPSAQDKPFDPVKDDPALPRVLLIGDSISIGYTVPVRAALAGKANVHRPRTNCGPTSRGLENIDAWLGNQDWDVIHFNWGLHDLKYINSKGGLVDAPKGKQQIPLPDYEKNMNTLVARLKSTGARLVWCATTPVPKGAKGRVPGDELKYNEAALRVMERHGVEVNDLHGFANGRIKEIQRPANVHFSPAGSKALAGEVSNQILGQLKPDKWAKAIGAFEKSDGKTPPPKGGIVFVGSSSVRKWNLGKWFPGKDMINRGFGGSQMVDSLHYAHRVILPHRPRAVVLYAGDNDINKGKTPERVFLEWKALVGRIRATLPKTRIFFMAIKPSIKRRALMETMGRANELIRAHAETDPGLYYVDIFKPMLGADGEPRKELFEKDNLHLNDEGYRLWTSILTPMLEETR